MRKMLVMKMRYIGDTVLVTPLIRALKTGLPGAQVHLLVNGNCAGIVRGLRHADRIVAFDYQRAKRDVLYVIAFLFRLRRAGYDTVIDLTRNDRSALFSLATGARYKLGYAGGGVLQRSVYSHQVPYRFDEIHTVDHHLEMAKALGLPAGSPHPELTVSDADDRRMGRLLERFDIRAGSPFVIVHPGARRWYKSWPLDRFARTADAILTHYPVAVVLAGGPEDRAACDAIASHMQKNAVNLCGRIPLDQLPALIARSSLLVGNDSAPIHIATAVDTPAVALFGPTRWENWQPRRPDDRVHFAALPCRPCGHWRPDCPLGADYCMSGIPLDAVWDSIRTIFNRLAIRTTG